jgi:hypothetical protein
MSGRGRDGRFGRGRGAEGGEIGTRVSERGRGGEEGDDKVLHDDDLL